MATPYASLGDFYVHGLRSAALVAEPRPVSLVDFATDRLVVRSHGMPADHPFSVEVRGGSLPAPLSATTVYYAVLVPSSDDLLQAAATPGGSPVDITTAGSGTLVVVPQIAPFVEKSLEAWSSYLDDEVIVHDTPLTTWPLVVTQVVCWLAAYDVAVTKGLLNPNFKDSAAGIKDKWDLALKKIESWKLGRSIKDATDQDGTKPDDAAVIMRGDPLRDWSGDCFFGGRI